ncbi:MAG: response regulator [Thermodesulfobacteriota bacterium]
MSKILILDQDKNNLEVLYRFLGKVLSEYAVYQSSSFQEGTELIQAENPVVVFVNSEMPEIERGIHTLRNSLQTKYLPVIGIQYIDRQDPEHLRSNIPTLSILETDAVIYLDPEHIDSQDDGTPPEPEKMRHLIASLNKKRELLTNTQVFLQEIMNISFNFAFVKDRQARYTFVNKKFLQAFGLTEEDVIGRDIGEILSHNSYSLEMYKNDIDILQGNLPGLEKEEPYPDSQGNLYWASTIKRPLKDASGNIYGIAGVSTDITQKKLAEEESRNLAEQLRRAQKMEAIGTLSGGIAHEFNNILSSVIGYTELAQLADKDDQNPKKYLNHVLTSADRAKTLVNQILAFVRQNERESRPLKIHLVIKEALKFLRATLPATITLQQKINARGEVLADLAQINQVVMNLCTNAIQSMNNLGGGTLTVALDREELTRDAKKDSCNLQPGTYLKLSVIDTGEGIPKEQMQHIFDPYYSTKTEQEGTGLGLSLLQGIVKNLGGEVKVKSEQGKGSAFSVYFPQVQPKGEEREIREQEEEITPLEGTGHVLFIDDEPELGDIGKKMLANLGYEVTYFSSGLEALGHFWQNSPEYDIVFVDLFMPGMKGDQLAEELRRIKPTVPIILCTGYYEYIHTDTSLNSEIDAFITKPFKHSDLARVIQEARNHSQRKIQH